MDMGGVEEIDASDDVGDSLEGIIVNDGDVVTGPDVFSHDNGIAECFGSTGLGTFNRVKPRGGPSEMFECFVNVDAHRVAPAFGDSGASLVSRQLSAGSGVEGAVVAVAGGRGRFDLAKDVFSRAKAWVEPASFGEGSRRGMKVLKVFALSANGSFPAKSEPGEVFEDLRRIFRAAAGVVDVFDSEEEAAT